MKLSVFSVALLLMGILGTQFSYADGRYGHRGCVNPLNPYNDPIVGVWNGGLEIPPDAPVPINIAFHSGGTGSGMDINDIGASGVFGSVMSYTWKKTKRDRKKNRKGRKSRKHHYDVFMSNFFDFGGFVRLGLGVTGKMSDDCQVLSLTGKISGYALDDPTLESPFLTVPVTIKLQRVNRAVHLE